MSYQKTRTITPLFLACGLLAVTLATGCNKDKSDSNYAPPGGAGPMANVGMPEPTGPFAAGKKVFNANCARCHSDGSGDGMRGGKMGFGRGPDLSGLAADAEHTRDWIKQHILDPQSHKENSRMPKFAGKLADNDLEALLDYLMSLK